MFGKPAQRCNGALWKCDMWSVGFSSCGTESRWRSRTFTSTQPVTGRGKRLVMSAAGKYLHKTTSWEYQLCLLLPHKFGCVKASGEGKPLCFSSAVNEKRCERLMMCAVFLESMYCICSGVTMKSRKFNYSLCSFFQTQDPGAGQRINGY